MGRRKTSRLSVSTAQTLAITAMRRFVTRKKILLETFRGGKDATSKVLVALERFHDDQVLWYHRHSGATAVAWQEFGPERELQEVRDAVSDPSKWDALVAKYRKPDAAKGA